MSFWGFSNFCVKFHKWGNGGMCLFFMWTLKVFCICILKFWNLQFSSCQFGGSYFFCVKFYKGANKVFSCLLETSKVFCFGILKFWSLQFFSCHFGVFKFFVRSFHKSWNMVCTFLHVNFEIFLFLYFENSKSSIFFLSFWRFHMGEDNVGGIVLKFGGFQICFDGVQGSLTLFLKFLGIFPNCL